MTNCSGSCSESDARSPGGSSMESKTIAPRISSMLAGKSMPVLQKICRWYSHIGRVCGSWAAILRTRGFTVNDTSTISSSVGS